MTRHERSLLRMSLFPAQNASKNVRLEMMRFGDWLIGALETLSDKRSAQNGALSVVQVATFTRMFPGCDKQGMAEMYALQRALGAFTLVCTRRDGTNWSTGVRSAVPQTKAHAVVAAAEALQKLQHEFEHHVKALPLGERLQWARISTVVAGEVFRLLSEVKRVRQKYLLEL